MSYGASPSFPKRYSKIASIAIGAVSERRVRGPILVEWNPASSAEWISDSVNPPSGPMSKATEAVDEIVERVSRSPMEAFGWKIIFNSVFLVSSKKV